MAHQLEIAVLEQLPHVLLTARVVVVQTDDIVAILHQPFAQVRADEASPSRHKYSFHT